MFFGPLVRCLNRLDHLMNFIEATTSDGTVLTIERTENGMYRVHHESGRTEFNNQNEVIDFYGSVIQVELCVDEY